MITGLVTAALEAQVQLIVRGPGTSVQVDATVDAGYNGYLSLPPKLIGSLGLPWVRSVRAVLADGSIENLDVYEAIVEWDGQLRTVEVDSLEGVILLGMQMLQGCDLRIRVVAGGVIEIVP